MTKKQIEKKEELEADRVKSINEMWGQAPDDFKKKYRPGKTDPLTNAARIVWQVLWVEAYSKKRRSRKNYLATGPMSLSQIAGRANLSKQTIVTALELLYGLELVIQTVKGGKHSKGSEYLVWHLPKEPKPAKESKSDV